MSPSDPISLLRRASQLGTMLQTFFCGKEVGRDQFGNRYFIERGKPRAPDGGKVRQKRWVIYTGEPDPSKIPAEWHIWLHYIADAPLPDSARQPWQKPHKPNLSGTPDAWLPPTLKGEKPAESINTTGTYEAWKPE